MMSQQTDGPVHFLAVVFIANYHDTNIPLTFSRSVKTLNKTEVLEYLTEELRDIRKQDIDAIVILQNGPRCPQVIRHWVPKNET